jgi:hypothetical protein
VDQLLEDVPGLRAVSHNTDTGQTRPSKWTTSTPPLTIFGRTAARDHAGRRQGRPGYTGTFVHDGCQRGYQPTNVRAAGYAFDDYRTKTPWKFDQLSAEAVKVRPLMAPSTSTRKDGVKTAGDANASRTRYRAC